MQYLELMYSQLCSSHHFLLSKFKPFGLFDDHDGYAGFTPCARYYWDFYVNFMTGHASEIDQHMALLEFSALTTASKYFFVHFTAY